ncbi:hypothetical protein [Endozoicomonas sp. 8E]|uniref:hypothetical protein n=1 Tax=Endozoicomonas sp. 8E TaxID=3035692 RepID=UPI002938D393|nr:hypothetical protein [Endozoicomonas sp. 8E]WOG28291.1 hypothetical protein P6910_01175 [Endozoicomonas sp. 8E]
MNPIKSNSSIREPVLPTPVQPQLEEVPTGVSADREVSPYCNNNAPFLNLPELTHFKIKTKKEFLFSCSVTFQQQ